DITTAAPLLHHATGHDLLFRDDAVSAEIQSFRGKFGHGMQPRQPTQYPIERLAVHFPHVPQAPEPAGIESPGATHSSTVGFVKYNIPEE
ncbi:MAG: hypothetical protein WA652_06005, partial [Xanthobacteraceae bacterium]